MESEINYDIKLDRGVGTVQIEDHLRHYSPVHAKYFFSIVRTFFIASFVLFSAFLV